MGWNWNLQDGWTPLHFAAWGGHDAVIEALYGAGADVNAFDKVMMSQRLLSFKTFTLCIHFNSRKQLRHN